MNRRTALVVRLLLLLGVLCALTYGVATWLDDERHEAVLLDVSPRSGGPTLTGREAQKPIPAPPPDPFAETTDVRSLLEGAGGEYSDKALARIRDLASSDVRFPDALVSYLREEHDTEWSVEGWNLEVIYAAIQAAGAACREPLEALLREGPEVHERRAARGLGALGKDGASSVPVLLAYARNQDKPARVRSPMVEALGAIGPHAKEALDWLQYTFERGDERMGFRLTILDAMYRIRGADAQMLRLWRNVLLGDGNADKRQVVETLVEAGSQAADLSPYVIKAMLEDEDLLVPGMHTLEALQPETPDVIRLLDEHVDDDEYHITVRLLALRALAAQGPSGRRALLRRLGRGDRTMRPRVFLLLSEEVGENRKALLEEALALAATNMDAAAHEYFAAFLRLRPTAEECFEPLMAMIGEQDAGRVTFDPLFALVLVLEEGTEKHRKRILDALASDPHRSGIVASLAWSHYRPRSFHVPLPAYLEQPLLALSFEPDDTRWSFYGEVLSRLVDRFPQQVVAQVRPCLGLVEHSYTHSGRVITSTRLKRGAHQALRLLEDAGDHAHRALPELERLSRDVAAAMQGTVKYQRHWLESLKKRVDRLIDRMRNRAPRKGE